MRIKTTDNGDFELTPEENAEYDAREAAWLAGARDRLASELRTVRDTKLSQTDWRFRSDMTPSQAWKDYCKALRNVPQQSGFPDSVTWPIEP